MTKDTKELAKECGFVEEYEDGDWRVEFNDIGAEQFRDAIEAPLLEQIAMLRDELKEALEMLEHCLASENDVPTSEWYAERYKTLTATESTAKAYMDMVRNEEAEACAKVCEETKADYTMETEYGEGRIDGAAFCKEAIRARIENRKGEE